jgi:hypothetical protein
MFFVICTVHSSLLHLPLSDYSTVPEDAGIVLENATSIGYIFILQSVLRIRDVYKDKKIDLKKKVF